jgi:phosphoglycolate phosphatase-like HAD superfamily hydrolase
MNLDKYKTIVFDCDGVILDSNKVKTEAFYQATLVHGQDAAQAMVDYHVERGGVSRFKKFEWFVNSYLNGDGDLQQLLDSYAEHVRNGLLNCEIAAGLSDLRNKTPDATWLVASGGAQSELRDVFSARGLSDMFDGGIFGSPDTKEEILERELNGSKLPALFIGDSKYDYQASDAFDLDFIFLTQWTEVKDYIQWTEENKLKTLLNLKQLLD